MRLLASAALILSLAACSKQESPPAVAAAPDPSGHSSVAQPMEDKKAPPTSNPPPLATDRNVGGGLPPDPAPAPTAAPSAAVSAPAASTPDGAALFAGTCATCHMADGSGVPYLQPSIKGSAWISNPDPQLLLSLVLRGSAILGEAAKAFDNDMAPQDHLTDAEIAALATYVRQRFAAEPIAKPVTPAEVAIARSRPGLP